jgi:hypothetical protein
MVRKLIAKHPRFIIRPLRRTIYYIERRNERRVKASGILDEFTMSSPAPRVQDTGLSQASGFPTH